MRRFLKNNFGGQIVKTIQCGSTAAATIHIKSIDVTEVCADAISRKNFNTNNHWQNDLELPDYQQRQRKLGPVPGSTDFPATIL